MPTDSLHSQPSRATRPRRRSRPPADVLRESPAGEDPRQRLRWAGPRALSDPEVLALALSPGKPEERLEQARELLEACGSLAPLLHLEPEELHHLGLSSASIERLQVAVELTRRLQREELPERLLMQQPEHLARYLGLRYRRRDQELGGAVYLDSRNRLLESRELYRGSLHRLSVEPRQILSLGLLLGASAFVFFHTHPSGDPEPSPEDIQFNRRLAEAGEVVGIRLVDHLILGAGGRWESLRQRLPW